MKRFHLITDMLLLAALLLFMGIYFDLRTLFYDTAVTGGDTASWQGMAHHLMTVLLPNGRLSGWDMGNFCGFPNFNFYFIPPFLVAALFSLLTGIPLTITLKIIIASGLFLFPIAVYMGLRAFDYRFPIPILGTSAGMIFLFSESYTMFGGNTLSTFAGQFCHMIAFSLFVYFLGSFFRGMEKGTGAVKNGIILGLIGLCHLFVFIPAVWLLVFAFFRRTPLKYLLTVGGIGFGVMAFWILPLLAYKPYTTPYYMIWTTYVAWRYAAMGGALTSLLVLPGLIPAAAGQGENEKQFIQGWDVGILAGMVIGVAGLVHVSGQFLILGSKFGVSGIDLSASPVGYDAALALMPWTGPVAILAGLITAGIGFRGLFGPGSRHRFYRQVLTVDLSLASGIGLTLFYILAARSVMTSTLREVLLNPGSVATFGVLVSCGSAALICKWCASVPAIANTERLLMLLWAVFGCLAGYFGAHFLSMPDVRFLPPLCFVLILILLCEGLGTLSRKNFETAGIWIAGLGVLVAINVINFEAVNAHSWFRYNNKGYEHTPGWKDFKAANDYLRGAYQDLYSDPLNAPRVGYEKCDAYGIFGGDRVFESLPYFSGRQTLEGIHYASSLSSKCITFLQTEFSRDIKTPRGYILARMNPDALPVRLERYNISQLILMTDKAREAASTSSWLEKEAEFGDIGIYRFTGCSGRYVEVPEVRPRLYQGGDWQEAFFQWYKFVENNDVLLVPESYVKDPEDRALLGNSVDRVRNLEAFEGDTLATSGAEVRTRIGHLQIRFQTNKVGQPHLIKVSYFPNWKVRGANGIYPVSPHMMLVIPRESEVVLTYGYSAWDKIGIALSLSTFVLLAVYFLLGTTTGLDHPAIGRPRLFLDRILAPFESFRIKIGKTLFGILVLLAVAVSLFGIVSRNRPVRAYLNGQFAFSAGLHFKELGNTGKAAKYFRKTVEAVKPIVAERKAFDIQDVILCMIVNAKAFENIGDIEAAKDLYRAILTDYPYCRYVGEANVSIARLERYGRNSAFQEGIDFLRNKEASKGNAALLTGLNHCRNALQRLGTARRLDPYSPFADYALQDIAEFKDFLRHRRELLSALTPVPKILRAVDALLGTDHWEKPDK